MDYDYFAEQLRLLQRSESASTSDQNALDPDMPPLEPITAPPASNNAMDVDDSNTTADRENAMDSEANRAVQEVEMRAEPGVDSEDPPLPEIPTPTPRPNRRARVEDDDDDERDRRHPTQRITNPPSQRESRTATPLPAPRPHLFAFDFLTTNPPSSSSSAPPPSSSSSSQPSQNAAAAANTTPNTSSGPQPASTPREEPRPAHTHRQPPPFSGFAISFDLDGALGPSFPPFTAVPGAGAQMPAPAPGAEPTGQGQAGTQGFADLFSNPAFLQDLLGIEPDVDDPERAEKLISGLEEVPVGLVKRLERIGGIGATGTDLSGGDSGCAVCWEKLLPDDSVGEDDDSKSKQKAEDGGEKKSLPKIVALPCAHVFHADCLRPWFSRPKQTTCPTCRFNIDPENLTYVPYRQRQRRPDAAAGTSASASAPTPAPGTAAPAPTAERRSSTSDESTSSTSNVDDASRGRSPSTSGPLPRRAGSEPPLNRVPRPPTVPEGMQSFAIPGGHVVFVSQPIHINAQGQSVTAGQGQQAQQQSQGGTAEPQQNSSSTTAPATSTQPAPSAAPTATPPPHRPTFGPPPPPGMTFPTNLPDGVIAFDIAFPIPAALFGAAPAAGTAAPGQSQPTPQANPSSPPPAQAPNAQTRPTMPAFPFPLPGGAFAGVNMGRHAGTPGAMSAADLLRTFFPTTAPPAAGAQPAQAAQTSHAPTSAPSSESANPSASPSATPSPATTSDARPTPPPEQPHPSTGNTQGDNAAPPPVPGQDAFFRLLLSALNNPTTLLRLLLSAGLAAGAVPGMPAFGPGMGMPAGFGGLGAETRRDAGPKKDWTPPPPPGPTLRQRIEKREREAGLRCSDISCWIGPSDEEPYISEADAKLRQLSIHEIGKEEKKVCDHSFHSSCLVSAERVALRGADASIVGNDVAVSCPVCRGAGSISKSDWDEGAHTLN